MSAHAPADRTTLLATYPTRRDAETARQRLDAEGIDAMITADDAGGVHLDLQNVHGAQLRVLEDQADAAQTVLEAHDLLPDRSSAGAAEAGAAETSDTGLTFTLDGLFGSTARASLAAFALLLLVLLAGLLGGV